MDETKRQPGTDPSQEAGTGCGFDDDLDEWAAWLEREVAAGRDPVPPPRAAEQGICVSLGDADGVDPGLLAAICHPEGDEFGPQFGQDAAADVLPPGPVLAALTETAVTDVARLSDNQLIGVLQAARRQQNREAWKKAVVIAEFARRRQAEFDAATARGVPVHCRPGQFPGEELAMELQLGRVATSHAIDDALDLVTRLPRTLAGMADGLIDEVGAGVISVHTRCLSPDDVAFADEVLASVAPTLRLDQLIRTAAALEKKLNPEAVKARKELAKRTRQRVEIRHEDSGNASLAGREMDTGRALASKAYIHGLALRLRRAGLPGTLDQLRLAVFEDLTSGRDPMERIPGHPADPAPTSQPSPNPSEAPSDREQAAGRHISPEQGPSPDHGPQPGSGPHPGDEGNNDDDASAPPAGPPVPMPALINLVVHAGTLFGWDTTPTEIDGWGLLDAEETQALVAAASQHPATRWCLTLLGLDGTATAHGCAPGQHPWAPGERWIPGERWMPAEQQRQQAKPPGRQPLATPARAPDPAQAHRLAAFLRGLNAIPEPIARGSCDHAAAEPRYTPSRKLAHLVRARTVTCDAPGCNAQAQYCDLDHTVPYPAGPTDQCNLSPRCRRHHQAKQAPDWNVEQPEPGVARWTLPSGRTHTSRPASYLPDTLCR